MESTKLSALLSSIISQLILILLFLNSDSNSLPAHGIPVPLALRHHNIAAALSLLLRPRPRPRRNKRLRPASDESPALPRPYRSLDSFKNSFLMNSSTFEWLAGSLEPLLDCRDPAGSPLHLSADLRLAIGLRRLSSGADFQEISDRFRVPEAVAMFCTKQLCRVLCTDFRFWVDSLGSASAADLRRVSTAFEARFGLPNCCGVIGCARFQTRKHEIAAQIVSDSSSRILSIAAGFPGGEKNNFEILSLSTLYKEVGERKLLNSPPAMVDGVEVGQYLVGGLSYPLLPWLMVPFIGGEECFDETMGAMRVSAVGRTVASLRNWGVLNRPIEDEVKTGVAYIGACSILHNALLMREDYSALADEPEARFSHYDQSGFEGDLIIESKALAVRTALASKAREFQDSKKGL